MAQFIIVGKAWAGYYMYSQESENSECYAHLSFSLLFVLNSVFDNASQNKGWFFPLKLNFWKCSKKDVSFRWFQIQPYVSSGCAKISSSTNLMESWSYFINNESSKTLVDIVNWDPVSTSPLVNTYKTYTWNFLTSIGFFFFKSIKGNIYHYTSRGCVLGSNWTTIR